ncbi:zinc ribbon domain-containing protein [Paenibacillus macerans]|uniref:zinc ribbon domain-containing protein n=1 Tax=Paenibacillus macerans TaxID=44252 RepID=UPI003D31EAF5
MNILQRLKDGAGKVTDRAQNVVEIGKLNTQISNIERELGLYYQKMGEVFYEGYRRKDMSQAEQEMLELAKTCDLLTEERDEVRAKIAELKNERLCGACGRNVTEDALFCQYCGHKLVKKAKPILPAELVEPSRESAQSPSFDPVAVSAEPAVPEEKKVDELDKLLRAANLLKDKAEHREAVAVPEPAAPIAPEVPVDPEEEARLQRNLERERKRQEELDRRIRSWTHNAQPREEEAEESENGVAVFKCQICSSTLVKGTKWCPHCGAEQI